MADRVVQAALKLVLEPIFETEFSSSSYGFRPGRRCQDAIEDIRYHGHRGYTWAFETDIASCFDEISHSALMDRVRRRSRTTAFWRWSKRSSRPGFSARTTSTATAPPALPRAVFSRRFWPTSPYRPSTTTSTPNGHASHDSTARHVHRKRGGATYRLVRYADDFVIMVHGTREHAQALHERVATILKPLGLRLAPDKTSIVGLDEGFDFLGFHIQRHTQRGSSRRYVYSYPSTKSVRRSGGRSRRSPPTR